VIGLVLTAGGARGAYQAGVLKRIGEIPAFSRGASPFAIVSGASAGAINGAMIAAGSPDFGPTTAGLARVWERLEVGSVVRIDPAALARQGAGLLRDMAVGSLLGHTVTHSMLDASPLRGFLAGVLPMEGIRDAIRRGQLYALALTATSYHSGRCFTFVQGRRGHPIWRKSRRVVLPVEMTIDHVLASASIPLVFSPVRIPLPGGDHWFGDGALRLVTPLSPAIRLGASRLLAIGVRSSSAAEALWQAESGEDDAPGPPDAAPPLAQICGVFMNAIFLDHLDSDLDHLVRMNELLRAYADRGGAPKGMSEPMREITPLAVTPSEDLALVAESYAHRMPRLMRMVLDGLGTPDAQSADLMSYLLFDGAFTRALVEIGYRDADARADEIEAFLREDTAELAMPA